MFFLQDHESAADSQSTMDNSQSMVSEENSQEIETIEENNETQESTTTQDSQPPSAYLTPSRGKKLKKKREDELLELAAKRLRHKPAECENWALSCAADLKKWNPCNNSLLKMLLLAS
ncbi:hypothetical protein RN001_003060 [Aquatica leii]|uniref:Uncharacterized protein n=1 Tax=Aquatica leii TaxID=1421715 RepID=A0AAN7Q5W8_9COLE|nr:hypothetical protein RN001_003060 [Aquatica leii]